MQSDAAEGWTGRSDGLLLEITAEFSRYTNADPLCCPSSRAIVRFRIDRTAPNATVVPVAIERSVKP